MTCRNEVFFYGLSLTLFPKDLLSMLFFYKDPIDLIIWSICIFLDPFKGDVFCSSITVVLKLFKTFFFFGDLLSIYLTLANIFFGDIPEGLLFKEYCVLIVFVLIAKESLF